MRAPGGPCGGAGPLYDADPPPRGTVTRPGWSDGARFEELDWRPTPMGEISLRRRRDPLTGTDVFEVKLDDDFLMSSLFTAAEVELARLALAATGVGRRASTSSSAGSGSATPRRPCSSTRGCARWSWWRRWPR